MQQVELFELPKKQIKSGNGYAATVGSYGNESVTCKQCEHYTRVGSGSGVYRKCWLMKPHWTNGSGTDIKASAPACRFFMRDKTDD